MNSDPQSLASKDALTQKFQALYADIFRITFAVEICRHESSVANPQDFKITKQSTTLLAQQFSVLYLEARILLFEQQPHPPLSQLCSLILGMKTFVLPELIAQYKTHRLDPLLINGGATLDGPLSDTVVSAFGMLVGFEQQFRLSQAVRQGKQEDYASELKDRVTTLLKSRREISAKRKEVRRLLGQQVVEMYLQSWILCLINNIDHAFRDDVQIMWDIAQGLPNAHIYSFLIEYLRHVTIEKIDDMECYNFSKAKLESVILIGISAICPLALNSEQGFMVGIPVLQSFFEYFCSVLELGSSISSQSMKQNMGRAKEALSTLYEYAVLNARRVTAELLQPEFKPHTFYDSGEFSVPTSPQVKTLMDKIDQAGYLRLIQGGFVTDELFKKEYPDAVIETRDIDWLIVGIDVPKLLLLLKDHPGIIGIRPNANSKSIVVTFSNRLDNGRYEEVEIATTMNLQELAEGFGINCAFYYDPNRKIVWDPLRQLPEWLKNPVLRATIKDPTTLVMLTALYKFTRYRHCKIPISIDPALKASIIKINSNFPPEVVDIKWSDKLLLQGFAKRTFKLLRNLNGFTGLFRMSSTNQKTLEKVCSGVQSFLDGKTFMALTADELQRCRAFIFANLLFESFSKTDPQIDGEDELYRKHVNHFLAQQPFCILDFFDPLCELFKCMTRVSLIAPYEEANHWLMGSKKPITVPNHEFEFHPRSKFWNGGPRKPLTMPQDSFNYQPKPTAPNDVGPSTALPPMGRLL